QAAAESGADLIVMGTRGASGIREALIGTISASVVEKAECPVIVVPEETSWSNFDRILYATSYEEGDYGNVEGVIEFAKAMNAEVILLHISSGKYEKTYEFDAIERFKESIRADSGYERLSFKLLDDEDVYEGINAYAAEIRADMLAMTLRHRPFMSRLFQRSMSKRMAFHTHIPLMVMHSKTA
ncbi:MAG: universal stress protein, partial [Bacteroidota bacterium]